MHDLVEEGVHNLLFEKVLIRSQLLQIQWLFLKTERGGWVLDGGRSFVFVFVSLGGGDFVSDLFIGPNNNIIPVRGYLFSRLGFVWR